MLSRTLGNPLSPPHLLSNFAPIAIIMFLNPLLGMAIAFMQLVKAPDNWKKNGSQVVIFLLATAIWISLVNITKTIASDQYAYTWLFNNVPERGFYATVFESWDGSGKEPVYSFITWGLYYLCGGSLRLFFFTLSIAIYLFHYAAAYKLFRSIGASKGTLVCGVIVLTFFSQYFVMTLHIIRQMLAAAVAIYAIVYRATEGKNNWWLLVAAPLIHTSAFFLVGISLIPWFYKWLSFRRAVIVLACFTPIITFSGVIGAMLGNTTGINAIDYAVQRLGDEGASDGGSISLSILLTVFIPLGLCALAVIKRYKSKDTLIEKVLKDEFTARSLANPNPYHSLLPIAYISLLLTVFVLSFSKTPLLQYRFFYYSYSFVPLLLPLLFKEQRLSQLYQLVISMFFVVRFFITHNESTFCYASVANLIVQPITFYFTGNFSPLY